MTMAFWIYAKINNTPILDIKWSTFPPKFLGLHVYCDMQTHCYAMTQ